MANNSLFGLVGTVVGGIGATIGGWIAYSALFIDHDVPLPDALDAERHSFNSPKAGRLNYYAETSGEGTPLLLVHSINAAATAYEVKPIFEHYKGKRPIYALELPGFGFSERTDRKYSVQMYVAAIVDFLNEVDITADVVALSLSSEFSAFAALEVPERVRSLAFLSPSGVAKRETRNSSQSRAESPDSTDQFYNVLANPIWAQAIFDLLATRRSIQFFLGQSFSGTLDPGLANYCWQTTHQPGARYAPLYFVSGQLFTFDIFELAYVKLDTPTIVLYDKDNFVNFDRLPELLAQNEHCRARRIPNTMGLPHFERMDKVGEALDEFWAELG